MRMICAVMVLVLGGAVVGHTQVTNAELGYKLTLPEGFTDFPAGRSQKDVVDCWTEATPLSANRAIVLCVQRRRRTLPGEGTRQQDVPAPTEGATCKWNGFEIHGLGRLTSQYRKLACLL